MTGFWLGMVCPFLFAGQILLATIAQVKDHVITTREIQMHYIVDRLLKYEPYMEKQKGPVDGLVYEWLLVFEARDFYDRPMNIDTVNGRLSQLLPQLKSVKGWEELSVKESELREMVRRKMEARRLFEFKQKASRLPVSDSEVEIEYKQNRLRYGTTPLSQVMEKIRKQKSQENINLRLKNWFTVLQTKYKVQRFAEYNKKN